jgi:hypothetical protein
MLTIGLSALTAARAGSPPTLQASIDDAALTADLQYIIDVRFRVNSQPASILVRVLRSA